MASLVRRGVLLPADGTGPAVPVPAVAGNLEVLRRPVLTVRLDVTGRAGARHGWFAVGAGFVGRRPDPARGRASSCPWHRTSGWGRSWRGRCPTPPPSPGRVPEEPPGSGAAPSGRLPLGLLDDVATPPERVADRRTRWPWPGSCCGGPPGRSAAWCWGAPGDSVGAGQVSWLATDGGWVGLRPFLDGSPRRLVDVVPVRPADLGGWVAPAVAALLEGIR